MPFLRTVLGDIGAAQAGICYAHEHLIIDPSFTTYMYPDFLLDSVERASVDVADFYAAGGRTLVDSMPCGGGRNVVKLAEISRRTGANIVCPTGLHLRNIMLRGIGVSASRSTSWPNCSSRILSKELMPRITVALKFRVPRTKRA